MNLEPGLDLGTLLGRSPAGLHPAQVSQVATAVAAALDHAHAQGLVHGDVRPSNIQVGFHGEMVLSEAGAAPLDPIYAAPERLRGGQVDGRADQYSLACTMFRLLTGRDPFAGDDRETVATAHLGQPVPSVRWSHPHLSADVDAVFGYALAKDPRYRYASCGEFANNLAGSLNGLSPAPQVAQVYLPNPPRPQWPWVAAAFVAIVALVAVAVVFVVKGSSDPDVEAGSVDPSSAVPADVEEWADTLYPQEIDSIFRVRVDDELLDPVTSPTPLWTSLAAGLAPDVVGGDDKIVILRNGTDLIGLDLATGRLRWPVIDLLDDPMSCAVHGNRIGCVASANDGSDSSLFILDAGTGKLVKTVKVPNRELWSIALAGDRFVVMTSDAAPDAKEFAAGYTTEGDEVWTYDGGLEMYLVAGQGILVDGSNSGDEVAFISTEDGSEVLRAARAHGERDLTWNVFRGGIAVQNDDWTGTDLYDLDGKKTSSVAGWVPGYQNGYMSAFPLPLLNRLKEEAPHYVDKTTIAAANPETGHLLWRLSGAEMTSRLTTIDDMLLGGQDLIRVYDCYTGEAVSSSPIDMSEASPVEITWIRSDGIHLVYNYIEGAGFVEVAYDISTGKKSWQIRLTERPGYFGGAIVAAHGEESVSRFG
ncbi:MAG TPA: hypothetical protein VNP92_15730 [Actinophytocola sp.]|nr:hypothetical protein [Actinophytocola sp.]